MKETNAYLVKMVAELEARLDVREDAIADIKEEREVLGAQLEQ